MTHEDFYGILKNKQLLWVLTVHNLILRTAEFNVKLSVAINFLLFQVFRIPLTFLSQKFSLYFIVAPSCSSTPTVPSYLAGQTLVIIAITFRKRISGICVEHQACLWQVLHSADTITQEMDHLLFHFQNICLLFLFAFK